ncbi:histidine kinase N-terminal 7TM domain-containing protein [Natrarchaeobius oligotrophus]|uniref:PAS domain-containing protein n=1 Tax=Natrarchaeobius chitinivorans TaxID=1679083 RepID=A0A3N6N1M6_NATCH|nr:histidine kinase N-terminal 7TM domain-containing protein [Natrarchaeobius chitinivorans]RQH01457.1 PAS domain-containing protein [Natrarchaeobius chitinivorans]
MPNASLFVVYALCGVLPLVLVAYVYEHRTKAGFRGMLLLIGGFSLWSLSLAVFYAVSEYAIGLTAANLRLLSVYLVVVGWLVIALEYADLAEPSRRTVAVLFLPAVVLQLLAWTDPAHGLVWAGSTFESTWGRSFGPAYEVHVAYNYILVGVVLVLFVGNAVTSRGLRRKQNLALFVSIVPPVIANAVFHLTDVVRYDVTSLGFVVSVFVLTWALFRVDLLDLVPIGRKRALDEMTNAVITLDTNGRVVDFNEAARRIVDADDTHTGQPVEAFLDPLSNVSETVRTVENAETELSVSVAESELRRHFDLTVSPIRNSRDATVGRLVVLQDVSDLKERERMLRERERELDLLRQVLTRALRHNVRNDVALLRGYGQTIADESDGRHAELASEIVQISNDLVETSDKARTVERLVDRDRDVTSVDLESTVEALVDRFRTEYPDASFSIAVDGDPVVDTNPALELAIQNLLENALEHADDESTVEVSIRRDEGYLHLSVADDGPGIPASEIDVLERGEETPLKHGSGLGLWVVYWAVEMAGASISFDTSDGTEITISIPASDRRAHPERDR